MSAAADGGRAPESRLARAFAGGARTALLLPIRDGVARIGVLEFLSRGEEPPTDDVVLALEAVGLQLGQFAALTRARQHRR
jgi:GAF domain-containing protein